MDANHESSIFDINHLRAALERLDLNEVATRTVELAEDYMPGCSFVDAQGNVHYGETLQDIHGLVLSQATQVEGDEDLEEDSDEVPFWVASWLDEFLPDIAERLRTALAEATWGSNSAPEVE